jgi:DNA-binding FadR family transcriptional regulator
LPEALAEFAERYGDQNDSDHAALVAAIESGRVAAAREDD